LVILREELERVYCRLRGKVEEDSETNVCGAVPSEGEGDGEKHNEVEKEMERSEVRMERESVGKIDAGKVMSHRVSHLLNESIQCLREIDLKSHTEGKQKMKEMDREEDVKEEEDDEEGKEDGGGDVKRKPFTYYDHPIFVRSVREYVENLHHVFRMILNERITHIVNMVRDCLRLSLEAMKLKEEEKRDKEMKMKAWVEVPVDAAEMDVEDEKNNNITSGKSRSGSSVNAPGVVVGGGGGGEKNENVEDPLLTIEDVLPQATKMHQFQYFVSLLGDEESINILEAVIMNVKREEKLKKEREEAKKWGNEKDLEKEREKKRKEEERQDRRRKKEAEKEEKRRMEELENERRLLEERSERKSKTPSSPARLSDLSPPWKTSSPSLGNKESPRGRGGGGGSDGGSEEYDGYERKEYEKDRDEWKGKGRDGKFDWKDGGGVRGRYQKRGRYSKSTGFRTEWDSDEDRKQREDDEDKKEGMGGGKDRFGGYNWKDRYPIRKSEDREEDERKIEKEKEEDVMWQKEDDEFEQKREERRRERERLLELERQRKKNEIDEMKGLIFEVVRSTGEGKDKEDGELEEGELDNGDSNDNYDNRKRVRYSE
jgi:hypothetical protein